MPRNFLFVNKDASSSSLTRSSTTEQSAINSHVQRGRRHVRSAHASDRRRPTAPVREKSPSENDSSPTASSPSNSSTSSGSVAIRTSSSGFSSFVVNHSPPSQTSHQSYCSHENEPPEHVAAASIHTAQQTSDDLISIASPNGREDSESRQETPTTPRTSVGSSPHDISQLVVNP